MAVGNGEWTKWSKWVITALEKVIQTGDDLTKEVQAIREDLVPRIATLEERVSAEKVDALTEKIQDNSLSLAKLGGAGLLGGSVVFALTKLAEALASAVQTGRVP